MEHLNEERLTKLKTASTSLFSNYFFLPAGSVSSVVDSVFSEEIKSNLDENEDSYKIITYESISAFKINSKETQTDPFQDDFIPVAKTKKIKRHSKDPNFQQVFSQKETTQDEIKRLNLSISLHRGMIKKIAALISNITGDPDSPHNWLIDGHLFNFIISKLEIIRSQMKRYKNKISQLERDKVSMNDLVNFYSSAATLIENSKIGNKLPVTPLISSRKNSESMNNSANTIRNTPFDETGFKGKALYYESQKFTDFYPNTENNLTGISRLAKSKVDRNKIREKCSISPMVPKPKRNGKGFKEKLKLVSGKRESENKKRRDRCKS